MEVCVLTVQSTKFLVPLAYLQHSTTLSTSPRIGTQTRWTTGDRHAEPLEIVLEILLQLCSRRSQIVCYRVAIESPIQSRSQFCFFMYIDSTSLWYLQNKVVVINRILHSWSVGQAQTHVFCRLRESVDSLGGLAICTFSLAP